MSIGKGFILAGVALAFAAGVMTRELAVTGTTVHAQAAQAPGQVYELRTYVANEGKFGDLNKRFRDHTVRLLAKHGMKNITYWTPVEGQPGYGTTLYYVLPHASREAAKTLWAAFMSDPEWVKARTESEANGRLTSSVTAVFLTETDYSRK